MEFEITYSCISHIGLRRGMNQDNFICDGVYRENEESAKLTYPIKGVITNRQNALFGVFDGMGGEARGEMASYLAAQRAFSAARDKPGKAVLDEICTAANQDICDFSTEHCLSACGTTAAMLMFEPKVITACNVGDSKIFRLYGGKLRQISQDHLSIAPYGGKPPLSQYLGIPTDEMYISPYITAQEYNNGDSYIICSDGLTDMVQQDKIEDTLLSTDNVDLAARKLLELALANGGKDNITLIVLRLYARKSDLHDFIKELFMGENHGA